MGVAKLEAFGSQAFLLPLTYTPPHSVSDKHTRRVGKVAFLIFLLLIIVGYTRWDCVAQYLPYTKLRNPAYLIKAHHGAVASENKRCSDIGVDALKEGGNAVDAAIAATFCTGVVNMFSYAWIHLHTRMAAHDTSLFPQVWNWRGRIYDSKNPPHQCICKI
jgi:gamma-glutamyltranspeptidase/glutathione hydrolase/leukotriene-C4 hydrolase